MRGKITRTRAKIKHKPHAGRRNWPWAWNSSKWGTKHVFPVNLSHTRSAVHEISHTQTKSQRWHQKQNLTQLENDFHYVRSLNFVGARIRPNNLNTPNSALIQHYRVDAYPIEQFIYVRVSFLSAHFEQFTRALLDYGSRRVYGYFNLPMTRPWRFIIFVSTQGPIYLTDVRAMYFTYFLVERFFKRHAVDFGGKILLRFSLHSQTLSSASLVIC